MTALAVADVRKRYGSREALRGVTFSASAGERLAVIGPSGAGKTTLPRILAGTLAADGGTVDLARAGWVPQRPALYGRLSVGENLRLFARLEKMSAVDRAVADVLALTGLEPGVEAGRLSGGNRQRLNVAIGLLGAPPVLLLADGELLFAGTPEELRAQHPGPDPEAAFVAFLRERGH